MKRGAAMATLWLAALCPFTASYAVAPLTETPTLFAIALALWAMGRFQDGRMGSALLFTFAVTFAALLRPDGALVGVALAPALVVGVARGIVGTPVARRGHPTARSQNRINPGAPGLRRAWRGWRRFACCWR
jgi:hypothetical protein